MEQNHSVSEQAPDKFWVVGIAALLALYCSLFLFIPALPFLDLPNHLARNFIISELGRDQVFDAWFSFTPKFTPYVLGDILFSCLISAVGPEAAARIWVIGCFLGFVAAASFYARAAGLSPVSVRVVELISIFLATNWFFLSAFSHFVIGCFLSIFALAYLQLLLNESGRLSLLRSLLYFLLVMSTFLMHLASAVFCGLITVSVLAWRLRFTRLNPKVIVAVMLPHVVTGICYIMRRVSNSTTYYGWEFRPFWEKLTAMGATFVRYDQWIDLAFTAAFLALLLLFQNRTKASGDAVSDRIRQEHTFILFVLGAAYLALPVAVNTLSDIDTRTLPYLAFFFMFSACAAPAQLLRHKHFITLAACIPLLNFAYISHYISRDAAFLAQYQEAFPHVPQHAKVYPVNTIADRGRIQPSLHASMGTVTSRRAIVPYILSSNQGEPVTYFHYRTKLYEPNKFWYVRDESIDWQQVATEYDYVIVTRPHDQQRIGLAQYRVAFFNDSVVLYEVLKQDRSQALLQ